VLVVDDNSTNREILSTQLAFLGVRHDCVAGGAQALRRLREAALQGAPFDLILLDWHMPDMDGLALASRIRAEAGCRHAALALLTSANLGERADECEALGIGARLTKPVRQSQLYACISSLIADARTPREVPRLRAGTTEPCRFSGRVLVAEDHAVNQAVALQMLQMLGCSVDVVEDGLGALKAVAGTAYDLVLMDCSMPVLDGFAATGEIRRHEAATGVPRVPIVALTANALQGDRERCLAAGMDDYLGKPFTAAQLEGTLCRWLRSVPAAPQSPALPLTLPVGSECAPAVDVGCGESAPLDPVALQRLRDMGGGAPDAFLRRLADAYMRNADADLTRLSSAIAGADAELLAKAAHRLKSASANVGATTLSCLCRDLEVDARAGRIDRAGTLVAAIRGEHARVAAALDRQCAEAAA
jgi:CheY-like chemotaxis protein